MVTSGEVDATFLALAGLNRLGRDDVPATPVPVEEMLPAVCEELSGLSGAATMTASPNCWSG